MRVITRLLLTMILTILMTAPTVSQAIEFEVSVAAGVEAGTIDGRVLLLIATSDDREPRFLVRPGVNAIQTFGVDINGLSPGTAVGFDNSVFGYPIANLDDLPPGDYFVQAVLHRYETFNRADGHTVKLPMDRGEGQQWNRAPGNLYSTPRKISIDPSADTTIPIALDQVIPPIEPAVDTEYVKHVRIQSELLTEFWGRPMELGAHVLLPFGYDEHPDARYPLMIFHGHFPSDIGDFRTEPPDPDLECEYSERFHIECYNRIQQQEAYDFYQRWISPDFPRFLVIEIQHPTPYYDDSYAVNSANLGPYGDAITHELIPFVEQQFRGLGEGWARFLYGGSTGGWEALAAQVFYPDQYNGAFAACPDPIDFRAYMSVNIYEDANAFYYEGPFRRIEKPSNRDWLGAIRSTIRDDSQMELVLGANNRSGQQLDIWEAVYSPVADNGYPQRLWDRHTGVIDHEVAAVLAGKLRPPVHPRTRLGRDRARAGGQDPHLHGRHGQLLPQQRRLPDGGVSGVHHRSLLRRRGGLRRPR